MSAARKKRAAGERHAPAAPEHPLLAGLNEPQRQAVMHSEGPLLILAGAGSGKTRVLTHRVAYLIEVHGVRPDEIVAITFTNKAAGEMKERIEGLVGPMARTMWISTFHSMCARLLRREAQRIGYKSSFTIHDEDDRRRLIKRCLEELNLDPKRFPPDALARQISDAKNQLLGPDEFRERSGGHFAKASADVYELYEKRHAAMNAMDFDDLLMKTVQLLEALPDRLRHYQEAFRYVLIDEYQDTNHAQYRLANLLAGLHHNLAVVGDDDQSIYSWRGADIRNILEFERDYPDATVIRLEQNYRSTQAILDVANAVVTHNRKRKGKNLWTPRGTGALVQVVEVNDERAEAQFVASEVQKLLEGEAGADRAVRPDEIAVLYRTNAQSRVLEEQFGRYAIAYQVIGGPKFYERAEIRDAIAYLTALVNPDDTQRLLRVVNVPKRGIGTTSLQRLQAHAAGMGEGLWGAMRAAADVPGLSAGAVNGLLAFVHLVESLQAGLSGRPVGGARAQRARGERLRGGPQGPEDARGGGPPREPGGARGRGRRVRQARRGTQPRGLPAGDLAVLRQRRVRRYDGLHHADDAAQRQGPRVSRGVHRRHGGGRVSAPARARRAERRGGASPRLCRHHARHGPSLPGARPSTHAVGRLAVQHAVALHRRDPRAALRAAGSGRPAGRWPGGRRLEAGRLGRRLGRRRTARARRVVGVGGPAIPPPANVAGPSTKRSSSSTSPPASACCTPRWARARCSPSRAVASCWCASRTTAPSGA